MGIFQKIFGSKNQREIKKLQPIVDRINGLEPKMQAKSDAELKNVTNELKARIEKGESLDDILPEAFAAVREASVRVTGMRHYDVQMIGGMVLHSGRIAEMRTGEGKTLVATLPAYLNALSGKGVHVVTVNDYLARRDAEWMGRIHGFLGLTTGVIVHGIEDHERQRAYQCDITYGQNNEFGFDYLRDNMKTSPDRMVQRGLNFAIVDEVDSILIDEARTPLIISGAAEQAADLYVSVDKVIPRLKRDVDYVVDEKAHNTMLTDDGVGRVEKLLGVDNLYASQNLQLNHHVVQALRAHTLYKRDVNYLVEDGKVVIVDEFTGRKMQGRRWSDGLHQAIEAKEGVTIEEENQTLATVTFQNYFRMYGRLSGMTGTADTEATEFHQIYKLDVVVIPTNKPISRKDSPDLVYKNEKGKFRAVISDIEDCHKRGQPVLVGTVSVEKSEVLAKMLRDKGLPFSVLNAKQHQKEAMIVAQAGRKGAITISTNMAGRGTDILLGGNAEAMAKDKLSEEKAKIAEDGLGAQQHDSPEAGDPESVSDPYRGSTVPLFDETKRLEELTAEFKAQCEGERADVLKAGGLKIIGTERHESRRIDNQLRGRAGRQGDPGASRFYLSLEDDLLRIFGLDRMAGLMERLGLEEDTPIESPMVTRSIEGAQKKVEGRNFDTRKNVLEYDDVMNQQRKTIYALRRQVLEGRYLRELSEDEIKKGVVAEPATESRDWTIPGLSADLRPKIVELIDRIAERVAQRDAELAEGKTVGDGRAHWRILRTEVWRQYGCLLDFEKKVGAGATMSKTELADFIADKAAASLIQQRERLFDLSEEMISVLVTQHCPAAGSEEEWDVDALEDALGEQFGAEFDVGTKLDHEEIAAQAWKTVEKRLDERETELTRAWLMYFARHFMLEEIDNQWIDHLKNMDSLREGIGLLGYGQKDPKKEYKRIGLEMFTEMMARIQANVVTKLYRVEIRPQEETAVPSLAAGKQRQMVMAGAAGKVDQAEGDGEAAARKREVRGKAAQLRPGSGGAAAAGEQAKAETVRRDKPKVGRNDPCPCGSGKKYKKCHGRDEAEAAGAEE